MTSAGCEVGPAVPSCRPARHQSGGRAEQGGYGRASHAPPRLPCLAPILRNSVPVAGGDVGRPGTTIRWPDHPLGASSREIQHISPCGKVVHSLDLNDSLDLDAHRTHSSPPRRGPLLAGQLPAAEFGADLFCTTGRERVRGAIAVTDASRVQPDPGSRCPGHSSGDPGPAERVMVRRSQWREPCPAAQIRRDASNA